MATTCIPGLCIPWKSHLRLLIEIHRLWSMRSACQNWDGFQPTFQDLKESFGLGSAEYGVPHIYVAVTAIQLYVSDSWLSDYTSCSLGGSVMFCDNNVVCLRSGCNPIP